MDSSSHAPIRSETLRQRGLHWHQQGELERARALYEAALDGSPDPGALHQLLGFLHAQSRNWDTAAHHLRTALQMDPHQPQAHMHLGLVLAQQGSETALTHLQRACELAPTHSEALNNLATWYAQHGRPHDARACYHTILEHEPQHHEAGYNLATLLCRMEQWDEAIAALERFLAHQPHHAPARCNAARAYLQREQPALALPHLREALRHRPEHTGAHTGLGDAFAMLGDDAAAEHHYRWVLQREPHHPEVPHNLARLLQRQARFTEAQTVWEHVRTHHPHLVSLCFELGTNALHAGDLHTAAHHLHQATTLEPARYEAWYNLASCLHRQGDMPAARQAYRHAHTLQPDHPDPAFMLASLGDQPAPPEAPADFVERLFNHYAPHFEQELKHLHYRTPEALHQLLSEHVPPSHPPTWRVMDTGCGTGWMGPLLQPWAAHLMGVDCAPAMLEQARAKGCYHTLRSGDARCVLASEPRAWDLITAADVLVYAGDLNAWFQAVHTALRPEGWWLFSCECLDTPHPEGYHLHAHSRYAHTWPYLEQTGLRWGFRLQAHRITALRHHQHTPVMGHVVLMQRASSPV